MEKGPNVLWPIQVKRWKRAPICKNIKWPLVALGAFQYFPWGPRGPFLLTMRVAYRVLPTFYKGALWVFFYLQCGPCCIQGLFNFPNGTQGSFPHESPCCIQGPLNVIHGGPRGFFNSPLGPLLHVWALFYFFYEQNIRHRGPFPIPRGIW